MSGTYIDKAVDGTIYSYFIDSSIADIGLTSITLQLGTQNCQILKDIRGYILVWDDRTIEESGIMVAGGCNRVQSFTTKNFIFN